MSFCKKVFVYLLAITFSVSFLNCGSSTSSGGGGGGDTGTIDADQSAFMLQNTVGQAASIAANTITSSGGSQLTKYVVTTTNLSCASGTGTLTIDTDAQTVEFTLDECGTSTDYIDGSFTGSFTDSTAVLMYESFHHCRRWQQLHHGWRHGNGSHFQHPSHHHLHRLHHG